MRLLDPQSQAFLLPHAACQSPSKDCRALYPHELSCGQVGGRCPLSAFRPHGAEGFCLLYVTTACRWLHTCELPQARVDSSLKPRLSTSRSVAPSTTTWWKFEVEGERFVTSTWLFKIRASGEWAQPPMWAYPAPACPHGPGQAPGGVASRGSGGRGTSLGRPEEPRGAWALTFVFFPSLGFLWSWASH